MTEFKGFPKRSPVMDSYTPVHNIFFEEILASLTSLAEVKLMLAIYRNTFGIIESRDENGNLVYRENYTVTLRQLSDQTNISEQAVNEGLKKLLEKGLIEKTFISPKKIAYSLKLAKPTQES